MQSQVDTERPIVRGGELETQCLLHAEMGTPLFVVSTPGTGKTSKVRAMAQNAELKQILGYGEHEAIPTAYVPCNQASEESINGIPVRRLKEDGSSEIEFAAMPFFKDRPMLLILDEVNRAKPNVVSALFPLLTGDPMINGYELHPGSLVVLMGNDPSHHAGVRDLDRAAKGRMGHYLFEPDLQDWIEGYAKPKGLDPAVIRYLQMMPAEFTKFDPESNSDAQPCPRTWEMVAKAWSKKHRPVKARGKAVQACIGKGNGQAFLAFAARDEVVPTEEQLCEAPHDVKVPKDLDGVALLAESLGQILGQGRDEKVALAQGAAHVLVRMGGQGHVEMVVQALRNAMKPALSGRGAVRLLLPEVQAVLIGCQPIRDLLVEVGRMQTAGAVR